MRQDSVAASPGQRDIGQAPLLRDMVLTAPHRRFENRSRQIEARAPDRLRQPALDHGGDEHGVKLEALGLVNGHHADGVARVLGGTHVLVVAGEKH